MELNQQKTFCRISPEKRLEVSITKWPTFEKEGGHLTQLDINFTTSVWGDYQITEYGILYYGEQGKRRYG